MSVPRRQASRLTVCELEGRLAPAVFNISTGFDNQANALLDPLTTDSDYVATDANGSHYVAQALAQGTGGLPPQYIGDSALPGSRWLYLLDGNGSYNIPSGHLDFQTQVDLTGLPAAQAQIRDLQVSADNGFVSVAVNGTIVYSRDPGQSAEDFTHILNLGDSGLGSFHDGLNTIDFTVNNTGFGFGTGPSPAALRVQGTVETPEVPDTTTTTLATTDAASVEGQGVTLTATVSDVSGANGTPTGSVEFFIDHVSNGMVSLSAAGTATFTTPALTAGTHSISAVYAGNGKFLTSSSDLVVLKTITIGEQFTFNQEGGVRLVPVHPAPQSGVTIGVGYDLGHKSKSTIIADLTKAGVDATTAAALAHAAGLTGRRADQFILKNPSLAITSEQANALFMNVYAATEVAVLGFVDARTVVRRYGTTDWANLNQKIKDVLADLVYRGDYTLRVRWYVQRYVSTNDLAGFTQAMSNKRIFPRTLSQTRLDARLEFLRQG
ncbi:MAG TPA: pesticin C-terminus-like muramidase [Gemmataceae bacterium]|nr:pesticin C-terminus-like muramidase [Gemmataceae bacterium]